MPRLPDQGSLGLKNISQRFFIVSLSLHCLYIEAAKNTSQYQALEQSGTRTLTSDGTFRVSFQRRRVCGLRRHLGGNHETAFFPAPCSTPR